MPKNDKEYNHNAETCEVIVRELTDEEQAIQDAVFQETISLREARVAAKAAAQAKLTALGLTVEDLQALGL
jgi:hypothetical protein